MSNVYFTNPIDPKLIDAVNRVADGLEHIAKAIERHTTETVPALSLIDAWEKQDEEETNND